MPASCDIGESLAVQPDRATWLSVIDERPQFLSVWNAPVPRNRAVAQVAAAAGQGLCCGDSISLGGFATETISFFQPDQVGEQVGEGAIAIVEKTGGGPDHACLLLPVGPAADPAHIAVVHLQTFGIGGIDCLDRRGPVPGGYDLVERLAQWERRVSLGEVDQAFQLIHVGKPPVAGSRAVR